MALDLANKITPVWPVEDIPSKDYLFMRIHRVDIDEDGEPFPRAFRNQPKGSRGMSTDWQKYAAAVDTQLKGRKLPQDYAIIRFTAGQADSIPGQIVTHDPIPDNRAHTQVFGDKDSTEVRERFMQIYQLEIALGTTS